MFCGGDRLRVVLKVESHSLDTGRVKVESHSLDIRQSIFVGVIGI